MAQQYGLPLKSTLAEPPPERGREHYRKMREPFAAELKDPATKRLLRAIISAENPGAGSAVVESLMNRTAMVNEQRAAKGQPPLTLKAMIQGDASIGGGQSFYGPVRSGAINQHLAKVDADRNYAAQLDSHIDSALNGADTIKGHTDQGSRGDPNYITGGTGVNINGERFNDWGYGGSRAWREKNQALAGSGGLSEPQPLDPTPNVGSGESGYPTPGSTAPSPGLVDPTPNVGSGSSDYDNTPAKPDPDLVAATKPKKDYGDAFGSALSDLGNLYSKGPVAVNAARATGSGVLPIQQAMPAGITPMVDPRMADAQRQQLALAMQRLNSGRLV
jgi:hypothetical protein